jgi:hypothetical protein
MAVEGAMSKSPDTLFICWSQHRSKQVALALKEYFDGYLKRLRKPTIKVEFSETQIAKGVPWSEVLLSTIRTAKAGIVCLTPENRDSAWLHFEGGAIATHGRRRTRTEAKLFSFLFTLDDTRIEGPLGLFQSTVYHRDYERDRAEIERLSAAVLKCFTRKPRQPTPSHLNRLVAKLRELESLPFREILPEFEGCVRLLLQALELLEGQKALEGEDARARRLHTWSAILTLCHLLESRERAVEVVCGASQLMFFERLVEVLSASRRALEQNATDATQTITAPERRLLQTLRGLLELALEPLSPVLDDAWQYCLYGHFEPPKAYWKRKLLLIHPLETRLQQAELSEADRSAAGKAKQKVDPNLVPPRHQLSPNEKLRALRSYWDYDRIAAYIHYCEDVSRPAGKRAIRETLTELTRAVLKEISMVDLSVHAPDGQRADDLPLRFALRALILKLKIAIGHGGFGSGPSTPVLKNRAEALSAIESRIKGETGLSFANIDEFTQVLQMLSRKIGLRPTRGAGSAKRTKAMGIDPTLVSLCRDFERLIAMCRTPGRSDEASGPHGRVAGRIIASSRGPRSVALRR